MMYIIKKYISKISEKITYPYRYFVISSIVTFLFYFIIKLTGLEKFNYVKKYSFSGLIEHICNNLVDVSFRVILISYIIGWLFYTQFNKDD